MSSPRPLTQKSAVQAIQSRGALLVYPIDNRAEPLSIWSEHFSDKMRWEWDSNGDDRVAKLWQIKTQLSSSRDVVYSKWFQGRATFFSKEVFTHLLAFMGTARLDRYALLPRESMNISEVLEADSPQSTKQIKVATELRGKTFERIYEKSLKALFEKFWVVGFGEVEDGAFPSLAVGATQALFEDLWESSKEISEEDAEKFLVQKLGVDNLFLQYAYKIKLGRAMKRAKNTATPKPKSKRTGAKSVKSKTSSSLASTSKTLISRISTSGTSGSKTKTPKKRSSKTAVHVKDARR